MKKIPMKWLAIMLPCLIVVSCAGCSEFRKFYWDHKIVDLCNKNSGITIYEKAELSADDYNNLPRYGGVISVPIMELVKENQNYYSTAKYFVLRKDDPYVYRTDISIVRKYDEKVIAKYSHFSRVGGGIKLGFHPSHFSCPDQELINKNVSSIFSIMGE